MHPTDRWLHLFSPLTKVFYLVSQTGGRQDKQHILNVFSSPYRSSRRAERKTWRNIEGVSRPV